MEMGEVKMKLPWEGQEIMVSALFFVFYVDYLLQSPRKTLWDMDCFDHFTGEEIKARDIDSLLHVIWCWWLLYGGAKFQMEAVWF